MLFNFGAFKIWKCNSNSIWSGDFRRDILYRSDKGMCDPWLQAICDGRDFFFNVDLFIYGRNEFYNDSCKRYVFVALL